MQFDLDKTRNKEPSKWKYETWDFTSFGLGITIQELQPHRRIRVRHMNY